MKDLGEGIAGAGNCQEEVPGCESWLSMCYLIKLSLGVLTRKVGMLMAPPCYEDQMS